MVLPARLLAPSTRPQAPDDLIDPVRDLLRAQAPDLVLVSPVVDLASTLLEYLKAARRLAIPTGICVASWDNLSSNNSFLLVPPGEVILAPEFRLFRPESFYEAYPPA